MDAPNNVNAAAIEKFVEAVRQDPSQARKTKVVSGAWSFETGTPQFTSKLAFPQGEVEVRTELPAFAGGWGTSPDPIQYCMHGLAACFAVTFMATATSEGVAVTKLRVTAENEMDLHKQMGLSKDDIIRQVRIRVEAEGADRDVLERLVALTEERCPGTEAVVRSLPLEVTLA